MIILLVTMFTGVLIVAHLDGASPGTQTLLSQIAHDSVGTGPIYAFVQLSTTLVLLIAANSAVNGFPRLLYFMARDGYVPRMFLHMGDRLAFTAGIVVLAVPAAILYAGFDGQTEPLIPLFAIGVFVAFTLAQSAMVAYWWRHREQGWRRALAINLLGALLSCVVALIAAVTKFASGAWIVVILIPVIVVVCLRTHRYYQHASQALTPRPEPAPPTPGATPRSGAGDSTAGLESHGKAGEVQHLAVVPIAELDRAALHALSCAVSMAVPVLALHVSPSTDEAERFHRYWRAWGDHLPLEVVVSPYRATLAPLANYIEALHRQRPEIMLTVVVPELIAAHRWQQPLHNRVAQRLRKMLTREQGIIITSVPFKMPE
jgi:hypothetical protein